MDSNTWDIEQPIASIMKKRQKQKQRRKAPAADEETVETTGEVEEMTSSTGNLAEATTIYEGQV